MVYKLISWWPSAFHVLDNGKRIGIVNCRVVRINGRADRTVWFAHNKHFFSIKGEFATRSEAAAAIPRGVIHHSVDAFS